MEQSRVTEWELGDDLPWREVLENEEKKLNMIAARPESSAADEDVSFVAAILANLDHSAAIECEQSDPEVVKSEEEALIFFDNDNIYGSSDESDDLDGEDIKTQEVENTLHPVTDDNLLQCKDPSNPPSADSVHQVFSHWRFGLH